MIKLIIPLKLLKDNDTCFMITGNKPYVVKRTITIDKQLLTSEKGTVFLCGSPGFIRSYPEDKEVKYECDNINELMCIYGDGEYGDQL